MKCEACGGDGQIEYGAYRGDDSTETRECRLCGGVVMGNALSESLRVVGVSAAQAGEALEKLGRVGITLKESTSGRRRTVTVVETQTAHEHSWKERVFTDIVEYKCETCFVFGMFSRVDGSTTASVDLSEVEKLQLSSRTMVRFPLYAGTTKTAKEHADERLEQLRQENEHRQHEAESKRDNANGTMNQFLRDRLKS